MQDKTSERKTVRIFTSTKNKTHIKLKIIKQSFLSYGLTQIKAILKNIYKSIIEPGDKNNKTMKK